MNRVILVCIFSSLAFCSISQQLGSADSKWTFDFVREPGVTELSFEKDTLIENIVFNKFSLKVTWIRSESDTTVAFGNPLYLANVDGLVLYSWTRPEIDTLVNFNASTGDHWTLRDRTEDRSYIVTVVDTFRTEINSSSLFSMSYTINVEGQTPIFVDTLFETIGSKYTFLIPYDSFNSSTHSSFGGPLRCFENVNLGTVILDNDELFGFNLYSDYEFNCEKTSLNSTIGEVSNSIVSNPVNGSLYFEQPLTEIVKIVDVTGRIVLDALVVDTQDLDVSSLASGVYILVTKGWSGKFIKQ